MAKAAITQAFLDSLGQWVQAYLETENPVRELKVWDTFDPEKPRHKPVVGLFLRISDTRAFHRHGQYTWRVQYRGRHGELRSEKIGTHKNSLKWIREQATRMRRDTADGLDPVEERKATREAARAAKSRTLGQYLDGAYQVGVLAHRRSGEATRKRLRAAFQDFMEEDMASITTAAMDAWRANRLEAGRKPTTLNRDRVALVAMLNQAVRERLIPASPLASWRPLSVPKADSERVRWLGERDPFEAFEKGERQRFMEALKSQPPKIRALVEIALLTGLRRGELFGLTWRAVDFRRHELTVTAATTKGAKTRRVPLTERATSVLKDWRGNTLPMPDQLVFPGEKGRRMRDIKRPWANLVKEARVVDFTLHSCRHDFASRLVQAGTDLYRVKELLGHASITTTERYAHLAPVDMAERAVLDDALY